MSDALEPVGQPPELREPYWPHSQQLTGESGKRTVFNAELDKIIERRKIAGVMPVDSRAKSNPESKKTAVDEVKAKAGVKSSLVGLALSGGGIRSGAFSLGVLETLRKTGLMKFVDYLSTVSGGGYAGAYWSTASMAKGGRVSIESKPDGQFSARMLSFVHTGNYLAKTAKFFNRYLPGLVLILTMCLSGLIAGSSGLAFLFRELDQPYLRDAIAALGFDDDFLAAIFPATCAFLVWSLAWLASYWKYGHRLQATVAGVLIWPLAVCVLAAGGLLLGTGDIGLPFLQEQLLGSAEKAIESKSAPNLLWWLIYSVVGASLLPYLKFPALVRSGLNPQGAFDKYTFRIASAALLVGVPFVAFSLLAREDVSGYLKKRGPEVAEADLFGGLNRDQRIVLLKIMRNAADHDMRDNSGESQTSCSLEENLKGQGATEAQTNQVLKLKLQFINGDSVDFQSIESSLKKIGLAENAIRDARNQIREAWQQTRDWKAAGKSIGQLDLRKLANHSVGIRQIACQYLRDEISTLPALIAVIDALTAVEAKTLKASELETHRKDKSEIIDSIRSLWPPKAKTSRRQESLREEIRPFIRARESDEKEAIQSAAWRYATDDEFLRRDLMAELDRQNLDDDSQRAVYDAAKNFWPPRHHDVLDLWEYRFAEQAVLELPRSSNRGSDKSFAGAAVASEKMSILQRSRYLMSFLFHYGLTPLVSDEATGVEHNPLYRIWSVRQRRRGLEEEIVRRLNVQILASPYFVELLAPNGSKVSDMGSLKPDCISENTSEFTCPEGKTSGKSQSTSPNVLLQAFGFAVPEASKNLKTATTNAFETSRRWLTTIKRIETLKPDDFTDALKDELESSIPLTRIEAAVSVRREQLRQDLIRANRELLEWHLAETVGNDPTKPVSLQSKERVFGRTVLKADQEYRLWFFWRAGLIFVVALFAIDMNSTSLHGFYRTQIARNWIEPLDGVGRELPLAQLDTTAHGAPYHLISTSLNLMGRRRKDPGDMQASYFLFSKLFCGSAAVSYAPTSRFAGGKYKLADAVAISGAAVSPAQNSGLLVRALLFLGNMRLGQWLPNPAYQTSLPYWLQRLNFPFWVTPARLVAQSIRLAETRPHVFVTDGGHHENLGVGPLLERRCRLILAFDAGADEEFQFADLANLVRWAKLKHGVQIQPLSNDLLHELVPSQPLDPEIGSAAGTDHSSDPMSSVKKSSVGNQLRLSKNHWIAAQIIYPPVQSQPGETPSATDDARFGLLIYVKTTLTGQEPFEVLRYARSNKNFPHDSTADQLYDPDQFATYVQLGQHIAQEIQDVLRQPPDRLWKQCGDSSEFQQNISSFLKTIS